MLMLSYYGSYIILIPVIILTIWAQININSTYKKYASVPTSKGISGAEAARIMMNANGLGGIPINILNGNALDNYFDPRSNTVNLSKQVYYDTSVASVCIACHEVGHAIQYAVGYKPIKIRNAIVPLVNLTNTLAWPLIILGIIFTSPNGTSFLFNLGVLCLVVVVVFHLVTLPVEFNASNRALDELVSLNLVNRADYDGSRKVLRAAAMTYVAALATAVMSLLRAFLIRGRN